MRQGQQHRRGRGRNNNNNNSSSNNNNNRRGHNPLARSFESNGPDVKVRGTPADIAAKYLTLARDAQSSGDPVLAENYFQHAEHYNRIIMAYREQQQQQQPNDGSPGQNQRFRQDGDGDDMGDDDGQEDVGLGDQPQMARGSGDQSRMGGEGSPRHEDGQPQRNGDQQHQRQGDNQPRFRDRQDRQDQRFQRHDRGDRQDRGERRDRFDRGPDRGSPDRGERHDRGERFDRGDRHSRGEHRFDRGDRDQRGFDRPAPQQSYPQDEAQSGDRGAPEPRVVADRAPVERMPAERPAYDRPVERAPVAERPVIERPLEVVEPRLPAPPVTKAADGDAPEAPVRAPRGETAARRRERFGLGSDQPEFLRRPVRRPRREAEGAAPASPVTTAGDEPSGQD